jgi:hypothetical protein
MNGSTLVTIIKNPYVIIGIIIVAVLIVLILLKIILGKMKSKPQSKAMEKLNFKNRLRRNSYKHIFREFKNHLPIKLKTSIFNKKHYLYINSSDDSLVELCTDVSSYKYEYYPEYTANKNYNFYLTDNIFISEIKSNAILNNDTLNNKHLQKFWKKFFSHQKPIVLISSDYKNVTEKDNDETIELNLAVRKKLNILSQAVKQPTNAYLFISNLNKNKGYEGFIKFIESCDFNYYILSENYQKIPESFNSKLSDISSHISRMLTDNKNVLDAANSINIIQILNNINSNLETWLNKITFNDGILTPPKVKGLAFAPYSKNLNPFELLYSKPRLNYKRRNICIAIAGLILIYLTGKSAITTHSIASNGKEEILQNGANNKVVGDNLKLSSNIVENSLGILNNTSMKLDNNAWTWIYPDSIALNSARHVIADQIYNYILLPSLKKTANAEKALFYIFLIKSNTSESLKNYIVENAAKWSAELGIEKNIIKSYVQCNSQSRLKDFKGATAYPNIQNFSVSRDQYRYLINLYTSLSKNNSIAISDVNNFLKYFYSYYNKRITIDVLLNKYYATIRSNSAPSINTFIERYYKYMNSKLIMDSTAHNLIANIDIFDKIDYRIPPNVNSFTQLMSAIDNIITRSYSESDDKTFSSESPNTPITERDWKQIVAVAKINTLLEQYYSNPTNSQGFFSKYDENKFLPITLNSSNNGGFMITGKYSIPGLYTKLAVESALKPNVKEFKSLLKKLKHIGIKTDFFEYKYNQNLKQYVSEYENSYTKLINNFSYSVPSATQLNLFLNTLSSPQSPLLRMINIVKENTNFKEDKNTAFMSPVTSKFKAFNLLLKKPDKNEINSGSLQVYFNILQQASNDIESSSDKQKSQKDYLHLRSQLSKLGKIAMNITLNKKDSYLNIVDAWLENINMPSDLRGPFVKPVTEIYNFGSMDLRKKLEQVWQKEMYPMVTSNKNLFPFDNNSTDTIDPNNLTQTFSPDGSFWQIFNDYYKPFLTSVNDKWQVKTVPYSQSIISPTILNEINKVSAMTNTLWDKNSNPKVINIDISPMLITEKEMAKNALIKMTYLNTSENEVIGINSSPIWRQTNIMWWKNSISSVGIHMSDGSSYNTPEIQQYFSFYKLLKNASFNSGDDSYKWKVDIIGIKNNSANVGFKIKNDPWNIFAI